MGPGSGNQGENQDVNAQRRFDDLHLAATGCRAAQRDWDEDVFADVDEGVVRSEFRRVARNVTIGVRDFAF